MACASAVRTGSGGSTGMGASACPPALVDGVIAMAVWRHMFRRSVTTASSFSASNVQSGNGHTAGLPIS